MYCYALVLSGSFGGVRPIHRKNKATILLIAMPHSLNYQFAFFISTGYYESGKSQILETSRHLKDVLIAKNYPVAYVEQSTAHGYLAWQGLIREGLITLLTKRKLSLAHLNKKVRSFFSKFFQNRKPSEKQPHFQNTIKYDYPHCQMPLR